MVVNGHRARTASSIAGGTSGHGGGVPVAVLPGRAEATPLDDVSVDIGVILLVLCVLDDQDAALRELFRVIRPDGELRFLNHVAATGLGLQTVQRLADATFWPALTSGCRRRQVDPSVEQPGVSRTQSGCVRASGDSPGIVRVNGQPCHIGCSPVETATR
jgi:SAM-dependent methyltransferase